MQGRDFFYNAMREGNLRHEYGILHCQACKKDIKGYRQEHLDALDIFIAHITGKDHLKKVRHLSEDAVWQKFSTDRRDEVVWLHHASGQVWKGEYRNKFADPVYDASADPMDDETRLLDWRFWQATQILRAKKYGLPEKQFKSPADPGDGSADTVRIRPKKDSLSSQEDAFDPPCRSLRPDAADLKNELWDEMMQKDEWVRDLSHMEDFDWKTYLQGIPKLSKEIVDEVTSFAAELHRTARCSWTDGPMFHFVATTPSLRILLNQHKSSRKCDLIYEDLQQNFLSLEEIPVDGKVLPTPQEKDVVAAFGGNCFYMRKMKNKLLEKSSSSEMSYRDLVRRFLKIQSKTLTLVEVAEDRNLLEFDCLRLIWKLRCDSFEREWRDFLLQQGLNTEFGDCREAREMSMNPTGPDSRHSVPMAVTKTMTSGHRVAKSIAEWPHFGHAVMLLILLNLILLGIEVDIASSLPYGEEPPWFAELNMVIVAFFLLEVVIKLCAFGCYDFFCGKENLWNIFDVTIVAMSLLETLVEVLAAAIATQMDTSQLRVMRFVRLARALRSVRVIRLLRYIGALRTIVFSIVSTMGSLAWTLLLLVLLFYSFGVIICQSVTDHCRYAATGADVPACEPDLLRFWSNIPDSMLTLFLSISGGLSWMDALDPLRKVSSIAVVCMIIFIVITVFAVLNVVTGVFCNTAIESASADKDIAIMKQMKKTEAQVNSLKEIFREIDLDSSDHISLQELKDALKTPKMKSFMNSLDISTQDVWTLFMVVDADNSGEISLDEFVYGCMQLQGPAKGLQVARMSYENTVMRQEIRKIRDDLEALQGKDVRIEDLNVSSGPN